MRPLSKANLLPLSDPEAVIRAANAARRHLTQPIRRTQTSSMSNSPGNTTNIPHLPDNSYRGWFRLVLKTQHAALVQSKLDREAAEDNTVRIRRLEDLVMALALKSETSANWPLKQCGTRSSKIPYFRRPKVHGTVHGGRAVCSLDQQLTNLLHDEERHSSG
ncbi:hypothetical protein PSTT_00235 [Puccinia striiformis]|uniref:Uncharacterized protein n=1 Tax=Puccinia striiformis TaxID=27350 RepID=A0A2S4W8C6_9BASI|nr:hypothetical protein PSTT_00235 [Puccinia striiformis]